MKKEIAQNVSIQPPEANPRQILDLFAGIGGFSLAARWMNWDTTAFVERDSFCQKLLKKNFGKDIEVYDDITTFDAKRFRGTVDVVCGGFPCQPFSLSGKRDGADDKRELSGEMLRVIRESLPMWCLAENVRGLLSQRGGVAFEDICVELEGIGYEVQPFVVPSYGLGFDHKRERVWILARRSDATVSHTDTARRQLGEIFNSGQTQRASGGSVLSGNFSGFSWLQTISRIHRKLNGVSRKMDGSRNRVLGNSLQPQIPYAFFRAIEQSERS